MAKTYLHWCKNGCGKRVVWRGVKIGFICMKCQSEHTKEEVRGRTDEN